MPSVTAQRESARPHGPHADPLPLLFRVDVSARAWFGSVMGALTTIALGTTAILLAAGY